MTEIAETSETLRLALPDHPPDVRQKAIILWSSLQAGSRPPDLLRLLEHWLRDPHTPPSVRIACFWGLLDAGGLPRERWPAPRTFENIDHDIPWELVDEVLLGDF